MPLFAIEVDIILPEWLLPLFVGVLAMIVVVVVFVILQMRRMR